MSDDSELVVEIHVPLVPGIGVPAEEYQFPWIDDITEFLFEVEENDEAEVYDDGEEVGDEYVFFISGASESQLISIASRVAALPSVPACAFAIITDDSSEEIGSGTRAELDG
jgi:hypothetical protein